MGSAGVCDTLDINSAGVSFPATMNEDILNFANAFADRKLDAGMPIDEGVRAALGGSDVEYATAGGVGSVQADQPSTGASLFGTRATSADPIQRRIATSFASVPEVKRTPFPVFARSAVMWLGVSAILVMFVLLVFAPGFVRKRRDKRGSIVQRPLSVWRVILFTATLSLLTFAAMSVLWLKKLV